MSSHSRLLARALDYVPGSSSGENPLWVVSSGLSCALPCALTQSRRGFRPTLSLTTVRLFLKHSCTFFLITELNIRQPNKVPLSVADLAEVVQQLPQLQRLRVGNLADGDDDQLLDVVLSSRFLNELTFGDRSLSLHVKLSRSARFEVGVMTRHHNEEMRLEAIWRLHKGVSTGNIAPADAIAAGAIEHLVQAALPAIRGRRSDRDGDGGQLPLMARHSDPFKLWETSLRCLGIILDRMKTFPADETVVSQLEPLLTTTAVFNIESDKVLAAMVMLLAAAARFPATLNLLCGDDGSGGIDQHAVLAVAARDLLPKLLSSASAASGFNLLRWACRSPLRGAELVNHMIADWQLLPVIALALSLGDSTLDCCVSFIFELLEHRCDAFVVFEQGKLVSQLCALATTRDAPTRNVAETLVSVISYETRSLEIMSSCGLVEKLLGYLLQPRDSDSFVSERRTARLNLFDDILHVELRELAARVQFRLPRASTLDDDTSNMNVVLRSLSSAEREWFAQQEPFDSWSQLLAIAAEKPRVFDDLIAVDRRRFEQVPFVGSLEKLADTMMKFTALVETHLRPNRPLDYPATTLAAAVAESE